MRRRWAIEEEEFLKEHAGLKSIESLAARLGRTVTSVEVKMKRLKIGNTKEQSGFLTRGRLAELLGVDRTMVKYWCEKYGLPYKKRKTKKSRTFFFIDPMEFWDWANLNREKIDFSRLEKNSIPPEPEWIDGLRCEKKQITYHTWTKEEESYLKEQVIQKKQIYLIAKELNRSYCSVNRKYKRLFQGDYV